MAHASGHFNPSFEIETCLKQVHLRLLTRKQKENQLSAASDLLECTKTDENLSKI
jgi:hypothetical protein